jgi:hypothetical protein
MNLPYLLNRAPYLGQALLVLLLTEAPVSAALITAYAVTGGFDDPVTRAGSRGTVYASMTMGGQQIDLADARASFGNLGVRAKIEGFSGSPELPIPQNVNAFAQAAASDYLTVTSRTRPVGAWVNVRVRVETQGALVTSGNPSQYSFGSVSADVQTRFTGFGLSHYVMQYESMRCPALQSNPLGVCSTTTVDPAAYRARARLQVGSSYASSHTVAAYAYALGGYRAGAEAAYFNSSHLYLDALDEDVTLTSESGALYEPAATVPEPTALLLTSTALIGLARLRRRAA